MPRSSTLISYTPIYPCLQLDKLNIINNTEHQTVLNCDNGIVLTVSSPLPNVFCLNIQHNVIEIIDTVPRDLEGMLEPMLFDYHDNIWTWTQNDIQLSLNKTGFNLIKQGINLIKTSDIGTLSGSGIAIDHKGSFILNIHTASMGNAHTWSIPHPSLQGNVAVCGLYGGVGILSADGFTCMRQGTCTLITTHSKSMDILFVSGTPIETTNYVSLLAGRIVPPPIWVYGLGLALDKQKDNTASLDHTFNQSLALRHQGIPIDILLPDDELALDSHGRFALFTENTELEDMELHKHVSPIRNHKFKLVPRISPLLKQADMLASEWYNRQLMAIDEKDNPDYLPNLYANAVISSITNRLESVFKHGIDAARLSECPILESQKHHYLAWKKIVYSSSMRWHGEGADRRAITFSKYTLPTRAGTLGIEVEANCNSFQGVSQWLHTVLTASHSGAILLASRLDIKKAPLEVLKRLAPLIAFIPICWLSDSSTLLNANESVQASWKLWTHYRLKLLPYISGVAEESARNGLPVLRSMQLSFPHDDYAAHFFSHQYLLGPALLVAPALHNEPETTVWLPQGENWYHLSSGTKFKGGQAIIVPIAEDGIAVFGREGHILCLGSEVSSASHINTIKPITDAWLFGLPQFDPCVTITRVKVMQMQGNAYIKGLEGTKVIITSEYTVNRRGAEVKIIKKR